MRIKHLARKDSEISMVEWKVKRLFKADPEKVDEEIKSINGGKATPEEVLDYAENHPESELHKCFEWDDTKAAREYRLHQARKVIMLLVRVPAEKEKPAIREYQITSQKNTYQPTREFLVNQDEYELLLKRALRELQAFREKYKTLSELEDVFKAIDEL